MATYEGGVIAPGIKIYCKFKNSTALLPLFKLKMLKIYTVKNTKKH